MVRNSWTTQWGEQARACIELADVTALQGYIRIERNKNLCGIAIAPLTAIIHH